jgi:membrane-associated phospholipid phosphatase
VPGTAALASGPWSTGAFLRVNDFARQTGWLHAPMLAYAKYGVVLFGLLLLAGWWRARRHSVTMTAAIWAPIATLLAVAINQPIVAAVHEARPYTALPNILVLVDRGTDPSFPSDHATMAGAVAAGLLLVSWRLGLLAVAAGAVMAFARVYVGAHYPQDVLAGLALGALVSLVGYAVVRVPLTAVLNRLAGTRLRPLLDAAPLQAGRDVPATE